MIHFHNACNGEADYYTTDDNVAVITRESGAVLVLGSGSNQYVSVENGGSYTTPGTYVDEISGNIFTVTADTICGTIGSTGIAVFYKLDDTPISDMITVYFTNNYDWGNGTQTVDITTGISDGIGYYLTSSNGNCTVGTYTYTN
ncbi:MAG: hypothetical protein SOW32_06815 [Agathobacter sp.]|nr:hypothetical protein [Agathobacter sp.]